MNNIADEIKTTTDFELDTTDGVKILKEDGWVIIRPSGTEPLVRIVLEGEELKVLEESSNKIKSIIKNLNMEVV